MRERGRRSGIFEMGFEIGERGRGNMMPFDVCISGWISGVFRMGDVVHIWSLDGGFTNLLGWD